MLLQNLYNIRSADTSIFSLRLLLMLPMYMIVKWISSVSIPWKRILSNWDPQISYSVIIIISKRVLDILHDVCIASWQSQPHLHKKLSNQTTP